MSSSETLLSVKDLHVYFDLFEGTAEVLHGVDFSVNEGEVVTIVGETGCGKSVTMKTILALLQQPPAYVPCGEIWLEDANLLKLSEREMNQVKSEQLSMVFQDPMSSLNPAFTIGEQLIETAQFGGQKDVGPIGYLRDRLLRKSREHARQEVLAMLREVQMPDPERIMDNYPFELSGGMQQRALIAQALLNDPDLLIADEIGTALDVTIHDQILQLLERLIEERDLTVLMITHNLGVARRISDRTYIMYAGRMIEDATTETIFEAPKHPYTQGLLESIPKLNGEKMAKGIDGAIPEYTDAPTGCRFHPRCPYSHEACRDEIPPRYQTEDGANVECVLYDESQDTQYGKPTINKTQTQLSNANKNEEVEQ